MEEQHNAKARLLGESDYFNRILEMNTEAERRKFAAQAMCAMISNSYYAKDFLIAEMAELAVEAADALIAELNKRKDGE